MPERRALRFEVFGTVQGVGFRPFVHRLATGLGLDGWAANAEGHVHGEVAGSPYAVEEFTARLRTGAPALAQVRQVRVTAVRGQLPLPAHGFTIRHSEAGRATHRGPREIPPDAVICAACLLELLDPTDRRFRYPFINCTDCGPRATVIEDLPYDRIRTTMRRFPRCAACATEYGDPADRRFHAEPLACPDCGPQLSWDARDRRTRRARRRGRRPARREACLACTPTATVGTYVIVHVGCAITEVDEAEAERTLDVLRAMAGAVEAELGEPLPGPTT
ncbi:acylphosphatase [Streptomyces sp. NPDC086554]|uniref:acylphosphatase n=1 Tax=Streptomyces sp. NPDC086554 TaxID=3154864 RepID=UPI0034388D5F